jgi:hypothetical protein
MTRHHQSRVAHVLLVIAALFASALPSSEAMLVGAPATACERCCERGFTRVESGSGASTKCVKLATFAVRFSQESSEAALARSCALQHVDAVPLELGLGADAREELRALKTVCSRAKELLHPVKVGPFVLLGGSQRGSGPMKAANWVWSGRAGSNGVANTLRTVPGGLWDRAQPE